MSIQIDTRCYFLLSLLSIFSLIPRGKLLKYEWILFGPVILFTTTKLTSPNKGIAMLQSSTSITPNGWTALLPVTLR